MFSDVLDGVAPSNFSKGQAPRSPSYFRFSSVPIHSVRGKNQSCCREFSNWRLNLLRTGLKYGVQGTIHANKIRKNKFLLSDGGFTFSAGGYSLPMAPNLVKTPNNYSSSFQQYSVLDIPYNKSGKSLQT